MGNFRKLNVWNKARVLTNSVYSVTARFPSHERFGLTGQMRRAAVSIMCNIAEGCGRNRQNELIHYLHIARGSATELDCQLVIARDQELLDEKAGVTLHRSVTEVQKMLAGLLRHLIAHSS